MSHDDATDHEHDLSAEYLYPADAAVLDIYDDGDDGQLRVRVAVPCPECSETVALTTTVETVADTGVELPLNEDYYD